MGTQAGALRKLINEGEHFFAGDCYSVLTARIIEHVGFKAGYAPGHGCSAFHLGIPDYGIYSPVEHIELCTRIVRGIDMPLIADADTLGDNVAEAFHFTRRYEQAGIAGIHVEDEVNPRHSPYKNGLIPIPDMQARIHACTRARRDSDFVVIARCDEYYWPFYAPPGVPRPAASIHEAIRRGRAYADAGADVLMYPVIGADDLAVLAAEVPVPVCVIGVGRPTSVTRFTLAGGWGWLGAAKLHLDTARRLLENNELTDTVRTFDDKAELIDQLLYDDVITEWARATGRPVW